MLSVACMPAIHRDWIEKVKLKCKTSYANQKDLAEDAQVSRATVSSFLNGKSVSAENFQELCDRLSLDRDRETYTKPKQEADREAPRRTPLAPDKLPVRNNLDRHRRDIPEFVGRDDALADLDQLFRTTDRVAVSGLGGLGKTELAWRWANAQGTAGNYPGGVCWVDVAAGDPGLKIVDFCRYELGIELADGLPMIEAQVAACWSRWQQVAPGLVLVIFDDVERDRYRDEIEPLLPPSSGIFRVLLTTRDRWSGIQELPLDGLSDRAAWELLESYVDGARLTAEPEAVAELLTWFGGLPLGLELAARYLELDEFLWIASYLAELNLQHESIVQPDAEMRYPNGIEAAIALSWAKLDEESRVVAMRLGLYAAAPIPLTEEQVKEWAKSLRSLVNLHLVVRSERAMVRLHPLVRQFVRDKVRGVYVTLKLQVAAAIVEQGTPIPNVFTTEQKVKFALWIPHLQVVSDELSSSTTPVDALRVLTSLASFSYGQGLYFLAKPLYESTLDICEQQLGADHPDTATSLGNLAGLYYAQGKYESAEPLYQRALNIYEQQLGADHPDTASSLNNLAGLYESQGKYESAEPLYQRALDIRERQLGADHPSTATSLNNLAELNRSQGKYESAEPLYQRALDIDKRAYGDDHPEVATDLNNLANLYRSQGKYESAEPLFQRALDISERQLGADHPSTATSLNNLAVLYFYQDRWGEAERLLVRALLIRVQKLGEAHPNTQSSIQSLASLIQAAIQQNRTAELSDHPLTQRLLAQLRTNER
jgi:tetratricopeptide (TPR) repeat protein/transcriptional regulator with XRE-family HTH domain